MAQHKLPILTYDALNSIQTTDNTKTNEIVCDNEINGLVRAEVYFTLQRK